MTYLGASAAALATDRNTWHTRADTAYDGGAWGVGTHWNVRWSTTNNALTAMTNDRNAWQANANTAYDSGTWGNGTHWHARYDTQAAAYNSLLAGLNSPDGETTVSATPAWPGQNGTSATSTLTIPRTGHFVIGVVVDGSANLNSFGSTITVNVGGLISASKATNAAANSGTQSFHAGWIQHGDYTAGQQISVNVSNTWVPSGSISITVYAHFVPNATYHN